MNKKRIAFFVMGVLCAISCRNPEIQYDNSLKLEKFVKSETGIRVSASGTNTLLVVLQNEDCICTEPNMLLTKELFESKKFDSFKKILIVNKNTHKIFEKLTEKTLRNIAVIYSGNNKLLKAGYTAMTDRVILYEGGTSTYYVDLHVKKPEVARTELL